MDVRWVRLDGLNTAYEREYPHPSGQGKIIARIERVGGFHGYWLLVFFGRGKSREEFPNLFTRFERAERMADFCAESDSLISICNRLEAI